uniref:FAD-binding PCMH-type domain-containing protein n=1 Tax=Mucochytrium quahogii TaxID=96639 RepID=A0A7S2RRM3_9STRA|mmetsp:Transcript_8822/g.16508  ORF Transcript_8822/g.16508 Transcript_8822/m.16508 type:complete len:415 (+) Transcript_8822:516-1760(+)
MGGDLYFTVCFVQCMVTGSLVIDCFYLRSMELSPCNRRLKVGAGVILGEVDKLLKPRNLFVPLGTFWGVGVVGLCLSGGWGWLNGKFGIPALSLIEIEMITSDGTLVVGTPHNSQSDLLWASRGAGGNFGVVLSVTLRVYPLDQYICRAQTAYVCPTNKSISQVMHNFVSVNESRVSPDFGSALLVLPCGGTAVEVVAVSSGNRSTRSIRIVEPFTQCGGWFRSAMELGPCDYYDDMQLITDDVVPDRGYVHTSSAIVDVIDEAIIAILIKYSRQVIPNKLSSINIMAFSENSYKGPSSAICGQPGGESLGTCLKPAGYWITIEGKWLRSDHPQGRGRVVEWCNQIKEELHTVCGNMFRTSTHTMGDDKVAFRVEDIFDKDAAKKLRHIKHKYDPTNMFRANKNIRLHAMPAHE